MIIRRALGGASFLQCVLLASLGIVGCGPLKDRAEVFRQSRLIMGTLVEITVAVPGETEAKAGIEAAFREMERLDELLGSHRQRGEVWALNESAYPGGTAVSPEVYRLLERAAERGRDTGGLFDITVGGLMELWSFETGGRVPAPAEIGRAMPQVGWDKLAFDEGARKVFFRKPGMRLDLGGIGKGYAVDRAFDILNARGIKAGIVNAGGDLRIWGMRPDGGPWRIGIQHPRRPDELLGMLTVTDRAIVTSGDYEKYFIAAGKRYQHILDPRSGYPAEGTRSVTVVAERAEEADAYATALVVMGAEKARAFLAGHSGISAVIVDGEGEMFISPELSHAFKRENQ